MSERYDPRKTTILVGGKYDGEMKKHIQCTTLPPDSRTWLYGANRRLLQQVDLHFEPDFVIFTK